MQEQKIIESVGYKGESQAKPPSTVRRALEPFSNTQLLVYTRLNTVNSDGTYRPFSTRIRVKSGVSTVTVLGVLMPHVEDGIDAVPIARIMGTTHYYELVHRREMLEELTEKLKALDYHRLNTLHSEFKERMETI